MKEEMLLNFLVSVLGLRVIDSISRGSFLCNPSKH
jgi:hypothetical protein